MKLITKQQIQIIKSTPPKKKHETPKYLQYAESVEVGNGLIITHKEWHKKTAPSTLINGRFKDRTYRSRNMGSYYLIERVR